MARELGSGDWLGPLLSILRVGPVAAAPLALRLLRSALPAAVEPDFLATAAAGHQGPLLVAHTHANHVLSDLKLAFEEPPPGAVLLHHVGLPDERIVEVEWADIDRTLEADHLTSLAVRKQNTGWQRLVR